MNKNLIDQFYFLATTKLPKIVDLHLKSAKNKKRYNKKEVKSLVDKQIENELYSLFKDNLPEVQIVREEGNSDKGNFTYKIYIDPIDGTRNFVAGNPLFAVSVGLWDHDKNHPLSGVVYAPKLHELYSWKWGEKSKLNGKTIFPSRTQELKNSLLAVCFLRDKANFKNNWVRMEHFYSKLAENVYGFRSIQSDALSLCWVASGKLDAAYLVNSRSFDVAGGMAICEGSGCNYTKISSDLAGNLLVAGNKVIFGELNKIVSNT